MVQQFWADDDGKTTSPETDQHWFAYSTDANVTSDNN